MKERKLTPKQQAFVIAYLETGNASEAYRRSYDVSRMKDATINNNASALLKIDEIAESVAEVQKQKIERAVMNRAQMLDLLTDIATADNNAFSEIQLRNCRHCWGVDFKYRWHSEHEYSRVLAETMDRNDKAQRDWQRNAELGAKGPPPEPAPLPNDEGGYGFRPPHDPNPECPYCLGEGIREVVFKDTRKLGPKERRLFAGVKMTKDGLEVKTASQEHAREVLRKEFGIGSVQEKSAPAPGAIIGVQTDKASVTIVADPLEAARQYQQFMKGE